MGFTNTSDLNSKKNEMEKGIKDIGKMTGEVASATAHLLQENASEYYNKGLNKAKSFELNLENRIQNHPVQSLLIVAGVGLLLGAIWNRR